MKLFVTLAVLAAFVTPVLAQADQAVSQPAQNVAKKKNKKKKKKDAAASEAAPAPADAAPAATEGAK